MPLASLPRQTLAEQTAAALRQAIAAREWGGHLPGERELSRLLDVSRPTLRLALAQLEQEGLLHATPGQPRRILRPTAEAGAVRGSTTVGLLLPGPLSELPPFALCWVDHLRELLAAAGLHLETIFGRRWYLRPNRELPALVRETAAACWVVFTAGETMQRWLATHSVPCVLSGSTHQGIALPSVDVDYRAVCRHAAGQLLAHGHTRLALLLKGPLMGGDHESIAGFQEAFAASTESHHAATPMLVQHDGTPEHVRRRLAELLALPEPPTGFVVGRSLPALTVATELQRQSARLPRPPEVICRDSDRFLDYLSPGIAQYRHDPQRHAQQLARMVQQIARGGSVAKPAVRLMPEFVRPA